MGTHRDSMKPPLEPRIMDLATRHPSPRAFSPSLCIVCVCCVKKFDTTQMHGKKRDARRKEARILRKK